MGPVGDFLDCFPVVVCVDSSLITSGILKGRRVNTVFGDFRHLQFKKVLSLKDTEGVFRSFIVQFHHITYGLIWTKLP